MLSTSYGLCDFVEFVVGFLAGLTKQESKIIFCSANMCSFKVGTKIVSLVFDASGIVLVMPNGCQQLVSAPSVVFRNEQQYAYSGIGLDRHLYKVCIATANHVFPETYTMLQAYHFVAYKPDSKQPS